MPGINEHVRVLTLRSWYACPLTFLFSSSLSTTSLCPHPTSCETLLRVQYFLPGFNRNTLRASGTTIRLTLDWAGGIPSYSSRRFKAAAPRGVLWGT